jgi:hypothetical protein
MAIKKLGMPLPYYLELRYISIVTFIYRVKQLAQCMYSYSLETVPEFIDFCEK